MNTALGPTSQDTTQKVKYVQVDLSLFFLFKSHCVLSECCYYSIAMYL